MMHVLHLVVLSALVVVVWTSSGMLVESSWTSHTTSVSTSHSVVLLLVVMRLVHLVTVLHDLKELLKNLSHVWMGHEVV